MKTASLRIVVRLLFIDVGSCWLLVLCYLGDPLPALSFHVCGVELEWVAEPPKVSLSGLCTYLCSVRNTDMTLDSSLPALSLQPG